MRNGNDLVSRVAVVTGGAGTGAGLGRGLVNEFVERGMRVAILDFDMSAAEKLATDIRNTGGEAIACHVDVTNTDSIADAVAEVEAIYGACNILCAHAAAGVNPMAEDLWAPEEWRQTLNGVLIGTVATIHGFLPLMRRSDGMRQIVVTASSTALCPGRFQGPYRASKVAVTSMAESLALELEPENIGVTISFPAGMTAEPMTEEDGVSGAGRATRAAMDALAGLDLPDYLLERFAALGEEMAGHPTDLAQGETVAARIAKGVENREKYIVTHSHSTDRLYHQRHDQLEQAFNDLSLREFKP